MMDMHLHIVVPSKLYCYSNEVGILGKMLLEMCRMPARDKRYTFKGV